MKLSFPANKKSAAPAKAGATLCETLVHALSVTALPCQLPRRGSHERPGP